MTTSYIHPNAKIGKNVKIEPFAVIYGDVEIGDNCWIGPHAIIMDGARIGNNCRIFPGAVISAIPQDLKFEGEYTTVEIGDNTTIRECATVNRATKSKQKTIVGSDCLLMAYSHVAHDCKIGNRVIIGNGVQIAGEVVIEDWAILSAHTLVHQFVKIGAHSFIQGGSKVTQDVPPFIIAAKEPLNYYGINSVGLHRRQFSQERINQIKHAYRLLYQTDYSIPTALEKIKNELPLTDDIKYIIEFIESSQRGIIFNKNNN